MKLCLFCNQFRYSPDQEDWSEYTPGEDASFWCALWEPGTMPNIDLGKTSLTEYRKAILTAETCKHYKQIEIEDELTTPVSVGAANTARLFARKDGV